MSLEEFLEEWRGDSPYVGVKTSGSTGAPKPMMAEKRRMMASARITCDFLGLRPGDTALLCMPLDYIAGKMMVVRSIERGLRLITVPPSGHPLGGEKGTENRQPFDAAPLTSAPANSQISNLKFQITFAAMVPMQVWNSLRVDEERERLRQIRHLIIGGGAIDEAMAAELREFPHAVWSTYGMTETLSHIALRRLSGPQASEWYTPFESVSVRLSEEGCLVIDAPEVCDGRLVTNDIAELSSDGRRFRILGRRDNVICSGGIKIQAEEVERQLRAHLREPYMVTRRRDAKFGEVVVLLTEGSANEARLVCERVLAKYHQPKVYLHIDHIPLTETGKPARRAAQLLCSISPDSSSAP